MQYKLAVSGTQIVIVGPDSNYRNNFSCSIHDVNTVVAEMNRLYKQVEDLKEELADFQRMEDKY